MASPYVAETGGGGQRKKNYLHAASMNGGGIMRGDSVAAVWPTLEIIRDIYSKASQGITCLYVGFAVGCLRGAAQRMPTSESRSTSR